MAGATFIVTERDRAVCAGMPGTLVSERNVQLTVT
jgi:hypothetical protein